MPRRSLLALLFAVFLGAMPLAVVAAPMPGVMQPQTLHQDEATSQETWTDPATVDTWSDPAAGETWTDPNVSGEEAYVAEEDLSGFTMPGMTPDNFTDSVLADIDAFWSEEFALNGNNYYPAEIVPVTEVVASQCGDFGPYDNPAAFCPLEDIVYYSVPLSSDINTAVGDFAWITVLAHEWGHHVQFLLGIEPALTIDRELQADCFAGAYAQRAQRMGFLQEGDVTEALVMNIMSGDPVEMGEDVHGAHGSSDYRVTWFMQGYFNGTTACFQYQPVG